MDSRQAMKKSIIDNTSIVVTTVATALFVVVVIVVCLYQYLYYSRLRMINIDKYQESSLDYTIEEIHWKDPDYDYIKGRLSIDGQAVTSYPVNIVFYQDDSDIAYRIPAKLKNHIEPDQEQYNVTLWPERDFMYLDQEYLYNAGAPSEYSEFYCLVRRDNPLRRSYKIGFLINMDGIDYLVKSDTVYKYED